MLIVKLWNEVLITIIISVTQEEKIFMLSLNKKLVQILRNYKEAEIMEKMLKKIM